MGYCVNPGNENFKVFRSSGYVDKSGMINVVNATLDRPDKLLCVCRPRRFGKTYASNMLFGELVFPEK